MSHAASLIAKTRYRGTTVSAKVFHLLTLVDTVGTEVAQHIKHFRKAEEKYSIGGVPGNCLLDSCLI